VDDQTWKPGWVAVPEPEQRRVFTEICAGESWLLDSAYGIWVDVVLDRVQLIVALDYPRWFSLQRLLRRTLARAKDRAAICNGNHETWRQMVSSDSILLWHFKSFRRKHDRIEAWCREADVAPAAPRVLRFTDPRALDRWIAGLESRERAV
jgi:adenylate kinase family enzyme